jgi:hypothetical protein
MQEQAMARRDRSRAELIRREGSRFTDLEAETKRLAEQEEASILRTGGCNREVAERERGRYHRILRQLEKRLGLAPATE